jgi:DNA-binding GntR family transcriptional regulator
MDTDGPLSMRAYSAVKRLITDGELQPGDQMNVRVLGERLGLSATPLKAALAALDRDGLVTSQPRRGYHVTVLGDRDVAELFELREALEPYSGRLAVRRGVTPSSIAELRSLIEQQRKAARTGNRATYNDLSQQFHRTLWRLGDNRRLNELMDGVVGQMSLVTTFTSRAPGRPNAAIDEHTQIVDLVETGSGDELAALLAAHVRGTHAAYRNATEYDLE